MGKERPKNVYVLFACIPFPGVFNFAIYFVSNYLLYDSGFVNLPKQKNVLKWH